jgi:dGTPase
MGDSEAIRPVPESAHPYRSEFQRDRDRIIHTNSFRRLKHKSQVFLAPVGDHYTTRLSHTIEVQQVARTISRALNLNEDLAEAVAFGHDLGHTPFGHIGEKVLDDLLDDGFHHSRHSVRIVETLEKNGKGLNLTRDVVEGIRRHSKPQGRFISREAVDGMSLEAQVVRMSDALAYLAHDINDALRADAITGADIPEHARERLGERHSERVETVITDVIVHSLRSMADARDGGPSPIITMSEEVGEITTDLRDFMFDRVYLPLTDSEQGVAAQRVVESLFTHFCDNSGEIPSEFRANGDSVERSAADMVCGMTDQYALRLATRLYPDLLDFHALFEGRV